MTDYLLAHWPALVLYLVLLVVTFLVARAERKQDDEKA